MRVDAGGPAADRHKLSGHRGRCGEARTGLTLTFRRRAVSLAAGRRCRSSPTSAAETVSASSRLRLSRPGIGREVCLHLQDHRFDRGGAAQALPAQRLCSNAEAQPAGIGAVLVQVGRVLQAEPARHPHDQTDGPEGADMTRGQSLAVTVAASSRQTWLQQLTSGNCGNCCQLPSSSHVAGALK